LIFISNNSIKIYFNTGRADVDKAVGAIPDQLKKDGNVKEETQVSEKANNPGIKVESEKSSEEDEEDEEIPTKKSKVEGKLCHY